MFQVLVFVKVDFFPLQRLDEAFAARIVVRVCWTAHARNHVVLLEDGDVFPASVLQPSIRVMRYSGCLAKALLLGSARRSRLASFAALLASSLDFLQGTFEKIHFHGFLGQQLLQAM